VSIGVWQQEQPLYQEHSSHGTALCFDFEETITNFHSKSSFLFLDPPHYPLAP
jgi:site-specific DNA-adenine methylase